MGPENASEGWSQSEHAAGAGDDPARAIYTDVKHRMDQLRLQGLTDLILHPAPCQMLIANSQILAYRSEPSSTKNR